MRLLAILALASLACSLTPVPASVKLQNQTKPAPAEYGVITGQVNLRDNPEGIGASNVVAVLESGQRVQVIQRGETWCKVAVLGDPVKAGWALCRFINLARVYALQVVLARNSAG